MQILSLVLLFFGMLLQMDAQAQKERVEKLKPLFYRHTQVPEPSDIALHPTEEWYYVVSDDGYLFLTDTLGKILRKADFKAYDCEGIFVTDTSILVVDEMTRKLHELDPLTLKERRSLTFPYMGGRNKSYESITFNPIRDRYVLITEKDPIWIFELDKDWRKVNEIKASHLASDISSATFHDGFLWFLSDEDMQVIKVEPKDYSVLKRWYVPIINPEGLLFDRQGRMLILSDDMERMYYFNHPEKP